MRLFEANISLHYAKEISQISY